MEELGVPAPGGLGEPALEAAKEEANEQQEAELPPPGSPPDQGAVPADDPPPAEGLFKEPRKRPSFRGRRRHTSCPAHRQPGVPRCGGR
eukprot:517657-Amphidinium_carterae.1